MDMINHVLDASQVSVGQSGPNQSNPSKRTVDEATKTIVNMLRDALELQPNEKLGTWSLSSLLLTRCPKDKFFVDLAEPLTSCGADSITFAQFKGYILKDFEVDVPLEYLSEQYSILDMINNILEAYAAV